jgi:hypothetical protein
MGVVLRSDINDLADAIEAVETLCSDDRAKEAARLARELLAKAEESP